ncbi:GNAT family N-acetyltransferase [Nocardiopsis sediminis]|uniref:GNAT family N-acetyltransferase n=1 Tax=Nocardiopsis sediminis TaxID=1778267 RepID=A0ABV8FEV0_9ACTN
MRDVDGVRLYVENAAGMWPCRGPEFHCPLPVPEGALLHRVPRVGNVRGLLTRRVRAAVPELVEPAVVRRGAYTLEDPFGDLEWEGPVPDRVAEYPVMVLRPGTGGHAADGAPAPGGERRSGIRVAPIAGPADLAEAERVIAEGFPIPAVLPLLPGGFLPHRILADPAAGVLLARSAGRAAAACVTYDSGAAVGVYWLATLPAYRSRGLGRAVMNAVRAAHPGRVLTLVATPDGAPLYASMGFAEVSRSCWRFWS